MKGKEGASMIGRDGEICKGQMHGVNGWGKCMG